MKALALLCILGMGCGPKMHAAGSALADCELGRLPSTLQVVIAQVAGILMGGADQTWRNSLNHVGMQIGAGQLDCIVQAVGAGIKGQMRKGQAALEYLEGARRSDEWLQR